MKKDALYLLLAVLAAGCGKKVEATPAADAAPKETPTSCLHAQNARAYVWRQEPLELALDVELDWTCKELAEDKLELTDTDIDAKLGDQKVKERYRLGKDGEVAEWDDPLLGDKPRLRGLFVYSVPKQPTSVGLRYGGVQILPSIPVVAEQPKLVPKASMRIVATTSEPGKEKGTNRVTALIELDGVPRSAGRSWKRSGTPLDRTFFFAMKDDPDHGHHGGDHRSADRVLDVDAKLVPVETPIASLPARPAKRFMLAEVSATTVTNLDVVTLRTSDSSLTASVAGSAKLVVPKETRARLDAAPPSAEVAAVETR